VSHHSSHGKNVEHEKKTFILAARAVRARRIYMHNITIEWCVNLLVFVAKSIKKCHDVFWKHTVATVSFAGPHSLKTVETLAICIHEEVGTSGKSVILSA
jgi:hypothetical protein